MPPSGLTVLRWHIERLPDIGLVAITPRLAVTTLLMTLAICWLRQNNIHYHMSRSSVPLSATLASFVAGGLTLFSSPARHTTLAGHYDVIRRYYGSRFRQAAFAIIICSLFSAIDIFIPLFTLFFAISALPKYVFTIFITTPLRFHYRHEILFRLSAFSPVSCQARTEFRFIAALRRRHYAGRCRQAGIHYNMAFAISLLLKRQRHFLRRLIYVFASPLRHY